MCLLYWLSRAVSACYSYYLIYCVTLYVCDIVLICVLIQLLSDSVSLWFVPARSRIEIQLVFSVLGVCVLVLACFNWLDGSELVLLF